MLMMVDPDVHFHVLPRYEKARSFGGVSFVDRAWPGPPDVTAGVEPDPRVRQELLATLRGCW